MNLSELADTIGGTEAVVSSVPSLTNTLPIGGGTAMAEPEFSKYAVIKYSTSEMIQELQRVAALLQTTVMSGPVFARHGRISRAAIYICSRCGHDGSQRRLEVHHKDRNPYNNALTNLEVLCVWCHKADHRMPARKCSLCGTQFQPKNHRQKFCSRSCATTVTARNRYQTLKA